MMAAYLFDIIIMLVAAVVAVPLFRAVHLGAVPGFLVAGVVVGPSGLALIDNVAEIGHFAEFGVVLLLFAIGIDLKPARLWLMRRAVFGLGTVQVLLTGLILGLVAHHGFGLSPRAAILIGPALALSSTAFVLPLLTEQRALMSTYGRTSFAILLLQDLAVAPLLVLAPLLTQPELGVATDLGRALVQSLVVLGLVILAGRRFLHPVLRRVAMSGIPEVFTASAVLIVLGTAVITDRIGLSMAMGAFLAGLLISDSAYRHQVMAEIQPFRALLLGLFFMSMGMSLNVEHLVREPLTAFVAVSLLIVVKIMVLWPIAWLFGLRENRALAVALLLAQSGEFALVLVGIARHSGLLDTEQFQYLLLAVLLSMLATPLLAQAAQQLVARRPRKPADAVAPAPPAPIVIAGFGRVGHRVGEILAQAEQPFVALDLDAAVVERGRTRGHPVFFGDVRQPEVLRAADGGNARIVIVTLDDAEATENVVVSLRHSRPGLQIYARGKDLSQCRALRTLGASMAISENFEASLELARVALEGAGVAMEVQQVILGGYRSAYHAQIDEESA